MWTESEVRRAQEGKKIDKTKCKVRKMRWGVEVSIAPPILASATVCTCAGVHQHTTKGGASPGAIMGAQVPEILFYFYLYLF